ncbi:MAG: hypothetical protein ABIG95_01420 [Candidatus Woesearchaeota archaeon]
MEVEKQIEFLKRYLEGLQKTVSEARKMGLDTKMAELRLIGLENKIKYAEVSLDAQDIRKVKILLARVEQEIPKV